MNTVVKALIVILTIIPFEAVSFGMGKAPTRVDSVTIDVQYDSTRGGTTCAFVDFSVGNRTNPCTSTSYTCPAVVKDVQLDHVPLRDESGQWTGGGECPDYPGQPHPFQPDHVVSWSDADGGHEVSAHINSFQVNAPAALSFSQGFSIDVTGEELAHADSLKSDAGVSIWNGTGGMYGIGGASFSLNGNQNGSFRGTITQDTFLPNWRSNGNYLLWLYRIDSSLGTTNNNQTNVEVATSYGKFTELSFTH